MPVKPSVTTTSTRSLITSRPSTLPMKCTSGPAAPSVEQGVGLFHQGVALGGLLADGQDADAGVGVCRSARWPAPSPSGRTGRASGPCSRRWRRSRCRTVGVDPGTGMTVAMAGRETPGRRPIRNKALAMAAPVLPALTMAQARPSRTASAQRTSEESRFTRTARPGSSSIPMTSLVARISHPGLRRQSAQVGGVADQQHGDAELLRRLTAPRPPPRPAPGRRPWRRQLQAARQGSQPSGATAGI